MSQFISQIMHRVNNTRYVALKVAVALTIGAWIFNFIFPDNSPRKDFDQVEKAITGRWIWSFKFMKTQVSVKRWELNAEVEELIKKFPPKLTEAQLEDAVNIRRDTGKQVKDAFMKGIITEVPEDKLDMELRILHSYSNWHYLFSGPGPIEEHQDYINSPQKNVTNPVYQIKVGLLSRRYRLHYPVSMARYAVIDAYTDSLDNIYMITLNWRNDEDGHDNEQILFNRDTLLTINTSRSYKGPGTGMIGMEIFNTGPIISLQTKSSFIHNQLAWYSEFGTVGKVEYLNKTKGLADMSKTLLHRAFYIRAVAQQAIKHRRESG